MKTEVIWFPVSLAECSDSWQTSPNAGVSFSMGEHPKHQRIFLSYPNSQAKRYPKLRENTNHLAF